MKILLTVVLLALVSGLYAQDGLQKGEKVSNFKAVADDGDTWELKNNLDKEYLVVYFYPGAMTGGCTKQACAYRDLSSELESENARVVGISGDKPESLKFFKKAHNLNFTLLSDESGDIARKFGVPVKEGGSARGEFNGQNFELERGVTTSRWTFVLDKKGKVVYKNEQVSATEDTQQVLNFLRDNT